jgi:hypothetical protein
LTSWAILAAAVIPLTVAAIERGLVLLFLRAGTSAGCGVGHAAPGPGEEPAALARRASVS